VEVLQNLDSKKGWAKRRPFVDPLVLDSMCEIQRRQKADGTSLGAFRPGEVLDLTIDQDAETWEPSKQAIADQPSLFFADKAGLEKIPYRVRYRYTCSEPTCPGHHQTIIDWELAQSFRNWREKYETAVLLEKIRERWLGEMCRPDKETLFFVGSQHLHPAAFLILGVFWPPSPKS